MVPFLSKCLALAVLVPSVLYLGSSAKNRHSKYDITHPVGNKQHAIIQITTQAGYSCTAFVVDKNRALTAGHCVIVSRYFLETELKQRMKKSDKSVANMKATLERLKGCVDFQCLNRIRAIEHHLQQELEARKAALKLKPDVFKVQNIYGEDTGVKATAEFNDFGARDYAILSGDFKNFESLPLARGFDIQSGDALRACGYASSKNPPVCIDFTAISNYNFLYQGHGYLVKGMSGGPVINRDGEVVGINSAVLSNRVMMSPIVGIFHRKFDKPKKEAIKIEKGK